MEYTVTELTMFGFIMKSDKQTLEADMDLCAEEGIECNVCRIISTEEIMGDMLDEGEYFDIVEKPQVGDVISL